MKVFPLLVGTEERFSHDHQHTAVGEVCIATPTDIEDALQSAWEFRQSFAQTPLYERIQSLEKALKAIEEREGEIAQLIHQENHKPIPMAYNEVHRAQVTLKTTIAELWTWREEHFRLDQTELGAGRWALVRRFPYGVVLAITPFNYPLNLPLHKVAPALAVGAPVILKPAPATPATAVVLGQILREAGFPPQAIQVIPTTNEQAERMVRDPRIAVLSFTGSAAVGWHLKSITQAKVVILELGGNAGVVVEPDAALDEAVQRIVVGAFGYSGQVCIAVQRILVHHEIFHQFREKLIHALQTLDTEKLLCPMIHPQAAEKVEMFLEDALQKGARLVYGEPKRLKDIPQPLVLEGVSHESLLWKEEVFGPVALLESYETFEEALEKINDSAYGLHAGVFTRDIQKVWQAYNMLEVGGVLINDVPTYRADIMPYGGAKASGLLREGPRYAMEALTEPRVLVLRDIERGGR